MWAIGEPERAHRERDHVHRAALHRAAEELGRARSRISAGSRQLLVGPASSSRSRADEGAVLDPGDVAGVGARQVGVRALRLGELARRCRRRPAPGRAGRTPRRTRRTSGSTSGWVSSAISSTQEISFGFLVSAWSRPWSRSSWVQLLRFTAFESTASVREWAAIVPDRGAVRITLAPSLSHLALSDRTITRLTRAVAAHVRFEQKPPQYFGHDAWLAHDLTPGETDHPPARSGQELIAPSILLEGSAVGVVLVPIRFHRETLIRPGEIDLEPIPGHGDPGVDPRAREAGSATELCETAVPTRSGSTLTQAPGRRAQRAKARSRPPWHPFEQLLDGVEAKRALLLRPCHRTVEVLRPHGGEGEQSSRHAQVRDPVRNVRISGRETRIHPRVDPAARTDLAGSDDLHGSPATGHEAARMRGCAMGEQRAGRRWQEPRPSSDHPNRRPGDQPRRPAVQPGQTPIINRRPPHGAEPGAQASTRPPRRAGASRRR